MLKGTNPEFHRYNGKLNLLAKAKAVFEVPETICGWGNKLKVQKIRCDGVVAKSLTSGWTTTNKALFTTEVQRSKLDVRYPWYLQEKINAKSDVTVLICGKQLFAFERDRSNLKGLDWRSQTDVFSIDQKWQPFTLTKQQAENIATFVASISVDWGRLDFMWTGSKLIFLEYNANGQFLFLDLKNQYGIIEAVADYLLRPCSTCGPGPMSLGLHRQVEQLGLA
jgi:hypothetical protein